MFKDSEGLHHLCNKKVKNLKLLIFDFLGLIWPADILPAQFTNQNKKVGKTIFCIEEGVGNGGNLFALKCKNMDYCQCQQRS